MRAVHHSGSKLALCGESGLGCSTCLACCFRCCCSLYWLRCCFCWQFSEPSEICPWIYLQIDQADMDVTRGQTPLFCPFLPNFGMTERPDKLRWCQSFCLVPQWRSYGIHALSKYIQLLSMLGNCKHPSCAIESSLKVNETQIVLHRKWII